MELLNKMEMKNNYETSDFYCASALIASGFSIQSIDKTNPKRSIFQFKNSEDLQKIVSLFWLRRLNVNVNSVFEAQRYLKSLIFNEEL